VKKLVVPPVEKTFWIEASILLRSTATLPLHVGEMCFLIFNVL